MYVRYRLSDKATFASCSSTGVLSSPTPSPSLSPSFPSSIISSPMSPIERAGEPKGRGERVALALVSVGVRKPLLGVAFAVGVILPVGVRLPLVGVRFPLVGVVPLVLGPSPSPCAVCAGDLRGVVAAVVAVSIDDRRGEVGVGPPVDPPPSTIPSPTITLLFTPLFVDVEVRVRLLDPTPPPVTALGFTLTLWGEVRGEVRVLAWVPLVPAPPALAVPLPLVLPSPPPVPLPAVGLIEEEEGLGLGLVCFFTDPFVIGERSCVGAGLRPADKGPGLVDKGPGLAARDPPSAPARASAASRLFFVSSAGGINSGDNKVGGSGGWVREV